MTEARLAGVEVSSVTATFSEMYAAQRMLQNRLNQLPENVDDRHIANKSIYWSFCIRAESIELVDWLVHQDDITWVKEMQMEAIDILHFVFNIGIEAHVTCEDIDEIESDQSYLEWELSTDRIKAALYLLELCIVEHINTLHWKTWKTYTSPLTMDSLRDTYAKVLSACLIVCTACGLDRQGIINMYFAKNNVNHERQDHGY
jgi:dimeric dUTPase (all-alpha-NTP-PPase superfamily)